MPGRSPATLPHRYLVFSPHATVRIADGGEQVTAVLSLLLIPVARSDPRVWHRQELAIRAEPGVYAELVAGSARAAIRLQGAVIYYGLKPSRV